jgi:hypothetical protein
VTHDRYFLDNVADWILEIDRGSLYPFKGNYTHWLDYKRKRLDVEKKQEAARAKQIDRELEWMRATPGARRTRSKVPPPPLPLRLAAGRLMHAAGAAVGVREAVRGAGGAPHRRAGHAHHPAGPQAWSAAVLLWRGRC